MQPSAAVAKLAKIQKGRACGRAAGTRVGRPPKCTEIGWTMAPGRSTQRAGMNTELVISPKKTGDERVVFRVQEAINASILPSVLAKGVPIMRNDMSFTCMPNAGPGGRLTVFHDSPWEACIHPKLKCYNPDHVPFGTRSEEGEERRCSRVCVCLIVLLFPRMGFHMPLCPSMPLACRSCSKSICVRVCYGCIRSWRGVES